MSDDNFCEVDCCECGIKFKFTKKIEEMWRKSGKSFFCPNGHSLAWNKEKETPEQKELKTLREKVKELQGKLDAALKDAAEQKKRADDLTVELEIWRPSTTETKDGSDQVRG